MMQVQSGRSGSERGGGELDFQEALLSSLPGILYMLDRQGQIIRWNSRLECISQYSAETIPRMSAADFFAPEERGKIERSIQRVLESGSDEVEAQLLTRSQQLIPYRFFGHRSLICGQPCVVGIGLDQTESLKSEDEKQSSQERYRLLAELSRDAIWDYRPGSDRLIWNPGFTALTGIEDQGQVSTWTGWTAMLHAEEAQHVQASLQTAIDCGTADWLCEHRFRRQDGTYAWVLNRVYLIRDEQSRLARLIGSMTDLSAQRKAQERISEQAALIDQARDAIIVHDLDQRILSWSKGATRVFGWREEEVLGRRIDEVLQDDPEVFRSARHTLLEKGLWLGEVVKRNRSGDAVVTDSRWTLLRDAQGQPKSVLTLATDITERKQIEAQFLRAQRLESIGTLAGGVAHDLNNVLTPILMAASLLTMEEVDQEKLASLKLIEVCAERGARMVKQVLSFARGVEGERLPVSVKCLVSDAIKIIKDTFPKDVQVWPVLPPDLWLVEGDLTQLQQVLLNLCVNARDAMPRGGRLTLEASNVELDEQFSAFHPDARAGSYVRILVEDNGQGMTADVVERIFDPFFTTKEPGKGTGLGLSTSLAIVKSHLGFVRCCSQSGAGTRFEIYLPALDAECIVDVHASPEEMRRGKGEIVLVIEDEAQVRLVTQQTLESYGYRVLVAEDGAEGVALFATHRQEVALVLTDMAMPVMDGPATIRALRRIEPEVLIITATGVGGNAEGTRSNHPGEVDQVLCKPYTAYHLLHMVRNVLDGRPAKIGNPAYS